MNILRNRFLNTASFLFGPNDPPGGEGGAQDDAGDDTNDGGQDDTETNQGGGEAGDDALGDDNDADPDEDPDLADLPPEAKAKAKAAIAKAVARETGWRDKQIDRLHGKRRAAEEDAKAAAVIAAGGTKAPESLTEAQIEERAQALAKNMSAQDRYDADANEADAKGRAAYGDKWGSALSKLPKLGGVDVNDMVDILATEKPHVVLFALTDPEVYERVMALPPAKRRTELVKLSLRSEPKARKAEDQQESKRPGDQPPPVKPINNGRRVAAQSVDLHDDKVSDDAWYAARNATRRKKFSEHA